MTSAQLYLQTSVVDRLTRPLTNDYHTSVNDEPQLRSASGHDDMSQDGSFNVGGRNVIDAATFLGSLQTGASLPPPPPPSVQQSGIKGGKSKDEGGNNKVLKAEELQRFLQRQQLVVKKRDDEIKTVSLHTSIVSCTLLYVNCCLHACCVEIERILRSACGILLLCDLD